MTNPELLIEAEYAAALTAKRLPKGALGPQQPGQQGYPGAGYQAELLHQPINVSTAGSQVIVPGVPGMRILVFEMVMWNVGAQDLELLDGTLTLTGPLQSFPTGTGLLLPHIGEPRFRLLAGNSLVLSLSLSSQVSGYVLYKMSL